MLAARGKKDWKTVKDYRDIRARLTEVFGAGRSLETIDLSAARSYVNRRLTGSIEYNGRRVRTSGARVLKELKFLERLARESSVILKWSTKKHFEDDLTDEVGKTTRKKRAVTPEQVVAFIQNLSGAARAFVITKVLTVMRNEELYNLRVGDVDLQADLIHYIALAKRKRIATVAILPPEVRDAVLPLMKGRPADGWLFTCEGRKVQQSSFRKQFLKASKAAALGEALGLGEDQELGGVSWIRHAVMTALRPRIGVDAVSKYANHSSVTVTEEVYDLDKEALELKSQAVEQARKIFRLGASRKTKNPSSTPAKQKRHKAGSTTILTPSDPPLRPVTAGFSRSSQKLSGRTKKT
jgi:integrase